MTRVVAALMAAGGITVAAGGQSQAPDPFAAVAEGYVRLVLAVGQHDPDYVDAYYGPPAWRDEAAARALALPEIDRQAAALEQTLAGTAGPSWKADADLWRLRRAYLAGQLAALRARVAMRQGRRFTFDEESRALYDAVAPRHTESEFASVLAKLERLIPGEGPLVERYSRFREAFVVPTDRLSRVFDTAIRACRDRTLQYIQLPPGERFTVEYVTNKPWGGYNWYQGQYRSLIQVNTDLPVTIDRALDLACHEGYPGHHAYNVLLEEHLVRGRGWIEFTVYPLFSPQSLIAEGTANYGIEVAFPAGDRLAFERDVLFPLAGLSPARAADYAEVQALVDRLSYAVNDAARRYLDGQIDAAQAAAWLEQYAMMPRRQAEQRVQFIDRYRSYVINYNLGRDLVRAFVDRRVRGTTSPRARWNEFAALLSSPRLPGGLH